MSKVFIDVSSRCYGKDIRTFQTNPGAIQALYTDKFVALPAEYLPSNVTDIHDALWPNQGVVLKSGQQSALAVVDKNGEGFVPIPTNPKDLSFYSVQPRNKEQVFLFNLLKDPTIRCIAVTGAAGTGKSTVIGAYALNQVLGDKGETGHEKMILSKPLEIVTSSRYWGTVPGDENDKFGPFLKSFAIMFENVVGKGAKSYLDTAIKRKTIDFFPLELMRGASLRNAVVWYDEAQNLDAHECATLGTRIDDVGNSKLILSGDLNQRDKQSIKKGDTGLHKLCSSPAFLRSPLTAHVDLRVIERGEIAQLFHDVFEAEIDNKA